MAEDQQTERWTIYKRTNGQLHAAIAKQPYEGTIVGPDTAQVEVVPAQVMVDALAKADSQAEAGWSAAERLAEASQAYIDAVRAYNAEGSKDAATRQSHTYQDLREAILAFRSGSSKEGS